MKYNDFIHMSVAGDGSCFFHSLAAILQLEGDPIPLNQTMKTTEINRKKLSKDLRKQCFTWLTNNLDYRIKGLGLTIKDEIEEDNRDNDKINTVLEYLKYMKTPDAYAGQIEIYAMSNILKRNIRVYIHNKGKFSNVGLGYQINNQRDIMKDIFLYHNLGKTKSKGLHHFEPLYPKAKAKKEVKEIQKNKSSRNTRRRSTSRRSTRRRSTRRRSTRRRSTRRRSTSRRSSGRRSSGRRSSGRRSSGRSRRRISNKGRGDIPLQKYCRSCTYTFDDGDERYMWDQMPFCKRCAEIIIPELFKKYEKAKENKCVVCKGIIKKEDMFDVTSYNHKGKLLLAHKPCLSEMLD